MQLLTATSDAWLDAVLAEFDSFLLDHAANERKASAMAMSMVAHYPDRRRLCTEMVDLALEELNHFRQVYRLISARGIALAADEKDPYIGALRRHFRRGKDDYFLDRLLSGAVIEARGAERFARLAKVLEDPPLQTFYQTLARSEANHHELFIELARHYFDDGIVNAQLSRWLEAEAAAIALQPIAPRLH